MTNTTKRTVNMTLAADLPFKVQFTSAEKTHVELSEFTVTTDSNKSNDPNYRTIRKAYTTSRPEEIKIYVDDIKYIVMDAYNITFTNAPAAATTPAPAPQPKRASTEMDRYQLLRVCIESNLPVYLYGPAGTGKNYSLQQISQELGLDFYFTNSVQQEYKLTGFIGADGTTFVETEFYKAFTRGGLFFLDELDASAPEVLVLLNAAIANRYFEFPNGRVDAHPDFRVVAAGNTVGTGADEQYTGRMPLDQATLDRFVFIAWDYDPDVENELSEGDSDLVEFIRALRRSNLNTTFSYRAIIASKTLMNAGVPIKMVLMISILKGLNKDAINSIRSSGNSVYWEALTSIQRASL